MIGTGFLPVGSLAFSSAWAGLCLLLVFWVRIYGTADPKNGKASQPVPVGIAAVAFVIWVFWIGGPFTNLNIPNRERIASLAVLVWSFVIPIKYKGPDSG
jgi:hypothetical protein